MASLTHKLPARGPMPWNSTKGNGFTTATPWIAGKKVDQANVLDEVNDQTSMFNFYKKLIALKKTDLFQKGSYYLLATDKNSYVYERDLATGSAIVAVSLSPKKTSVKIPKEYTAEKLVAGEYQLANGKLTLMPYAGVVLTRK